MDQGLLSPDIGEHQMQEVRTNIPACDSTRVTDLLYSISAVSSGLIQHR